MGIRQAEVVIDCADHEVVVPFWVAALDWRRRDINEQYVAVLPPKDRQRRGTVAADEGAGPANVAALPLLFQKVPEGKVVKNRLHLDFRSDDREAEVLRLRGLGAVEIVTRSLGSLTWTVMEDPEGNEFCVS